MLLQPSRSGREPEHPFASANSLRPLVNTPEMRSVARKQTRTAQSPIGRKISNSSFTNSIADALASAGGARRSDFQTGAPFADFRWNSTSYSKRLTFGTTETAYRRFVPISLATMTPFTLRSFPIVCRTQPM